MKDIYKRMSEHGGARSWEKQLQKEKHAATGHIILSHSTVRKVSCVCVHADTVEDVLQLKMQVKQMLCRAAVLSTINRCV